MLYFKHKTRKKAQKEIRKKELKVWEEELRLRDCLINKSNNYIKNLAKKLKTVIPKNDSNLFNLLVECKDRYDLSN